MTTLADAAEADRALKAKHRAMWAMGNYPAVAFEVIPQLGAILVEACAVVPGDRVLDVAAGSGNAAIPAALAGARVTASDLTPELLEAGRELATKRGLGLAPPPPDAQPPPLWGSEDHVRALLGDRVTDVVVRRQTIRVDRFATPEVFRDYSKANYGPTVAAYKNVADDPNKAAALDHDLAELPRRNDHCMGSTAMDWEYLLITARKNS